MSWPVAADYDEAVQNPRFNLFDEELRLGEPERLNSETPAVIAGNFACVYPFKCGSRRVALRCFLRDLPDHQERYAAIGRLLDRLRLKCTVDFKFLPRGIRVGSDWYPALKMDWVEGELLNDYLERHLDEPARLRALADKWLDMSQWLRTAGIAHGDLQHGNVIINGGQLKLVDYDGMFVPDLRGETSHEIGIEHYQHPRRAFEDFGPFLDNFSDWVIYTTIIALSHNKYWWTRVNVQDRHLLFRKEDFERPDDSELFDLFEHSKVHGLRDLSRMLKRAAKGEIKDVPPLARLAVSSAISTGDSAQAPSGSRKGVRRRHVSGRTPFVEGQPADAHDDADGEALSAMASGGQDGGAADHSSNGGERQQADMALAKSAKSAAPAGSPGGDGKGRAGATLPETAGTKGKTPSPRGPQAVWWLVALAAGLVVVAGFLVFGPFAFDNRSIGLAPGTTTGSAAPAETGPSPDEPPERADPSIPYLQQAEEAFKARNFPAAIEELEEAVRVNPQSAEAYGKLGFAYNATRQYDKAVVAFTREFELGRKPALDYSNRAHAYNNLGRFDQAINDGDIAIKLDPKLDVAYTVRGAAYNGLGRYQKAVEELSVAIKRNSKFARAYKYRGIAYMGLGEPENALADLNSAIALDASHADSYYHRSQVNESLGNMDAAVNDSKKAAALYAANGDTQGVERSKLALEELKTLTSGAPVPLAHEVSRIASGEIKVEATTPQQKGVNLEAYVRAVERRVKRFWSLSKNVQKPNQLVIKFKIHRGGEVSNLSVLDKSGNPVFDRSAMRAVLDASPFHPLPDGAPDAVDVELKF